MSAQHRVLLAGGLLALSALALPPVAHGQRSGVDIWANTCGRCHSLPATNRYQAKDWASIGTHMIITARLTSEQGEKVLAFLKSGALRVAEAEAQSPGTPAVRGAKLTAHTTFDPAPAEETFETQCAACHGASGKGDGPAAVAFDPPPKDFTVPRDPPISDAELAKTVKEGRGGMPGFAAQLSDDEIAALVEYIRSLSDEPPKGNIAP